MRMQGFSQPVRPAILTMGLMLLSALLPAQGVIAVDPKLPAYEKVSGISGKLSSIGSDTLNNLMYFWNESFHKVYPAVVVQVEGKGSSTAPPALTQGTAQLGPMSREMSSKEIDDFVKKFGFAPTKIGVALDSLAVFVNKDNPIESLTMPQIDAVFSKTRKLGHPQDVATWGHLGLGEAWANRPVSLYGRNSASGTYGYFKEHALGKGDFKDTVKEQPGSASVVQSVSEDLAGIGYSGIGYLTSGVKTLSLAVKEGAQPYPPTYENVLANKYPLSRMLYIYIVKTPGKPLDPTVREFLRFVLSKEGQELVVKDGYLPLPAAIVEKQLKILEAGDATSGN